MHFLLMRIVFNTCFAQLLKVAQVRDRQMLPAALVNYVVATLLSGLGWFLFHEPAPQAISVWLGLFTGLTYGLSLLGIEAAMLISGIGITVAVLQLSVIVPTFFSMIYFGERPTLWQIVGIAAALTALPLLSHARASETLTPVHPARAVAALLTLFFITGCSGITMKAFQVYAPPHDRLAYSAALFAVASAVVGVTMARRSTPWGPSALPIGSLVGGCNLLQLEATLRALAVLPAVVVFPVSSALTVAVNALLAVRFWKERLDKLAWVGIALAILSAALVNRVDTDKNKMKPPMNADKRR